MSPHPGPRPTRRFFALTGGLLAALLALLAAQLYGVHVNHTASLPGVLYRRAPAPPAVGRTALACVPEPYAAFARARGYIPARGWARCPARLEPVGKIIAAGPGDAVAWQGDTVLTINGAPVPYSAPLGQDRRGRPLAAYPWQGQPLRAGEYLLLSPHHSASFDSRYFGPVPRRWIVAILEPL